MRDSFIFYKSFYESVKELEPEIQVQIYNAIMEYEFNENEVELSGISKAIFTLIKPQLEANDKRYKNGKKGGAPKGNQNAKKQPKNNQKTTKKQPNENDNENVNVNDKKENTKRKKFTKPSLEEVKQYCLERQNGIDAENFIDFYESKNWLIGKTQMKDWKACIRTWERNRKPKQVVVDTIPGWFDTDQKVELLTKQKQDEMEAILKDLEE